MEVGWDGVGWDGVGWGGMGWDWKEGLWDGIRDGMVMGWWWDGGGMGWDVMAWHGMAWEGGVIG